MYLIRLDDACEHWNKDNWHKMHDLLFKYNIKPLVAIIPKCEDKALLKYPYDSEYESTIKNWISDGWTPCLHGYNHVFQTSESGINPVNNFSEFAGVSLDLQKEKIRAGYELLKNKDINPEVFVAPAHTFDLNTLEAIKSESKIRIISDTVANDIYKDGDFYFIPQQSGMVRNLRFKIVTFCYHPNTMSQNNFIDLEEFIIKHKDNFVSFNDLNFRNRKKSVYDRILSFIYFHK